MKAKSMSQRSKPLALAKLTKRDCKNIRGIFSDIDDTISINGKIPSSAYKALWDAKKAGLRVIPVTGRPAGWVDHLARMWPVDAVIGENGAFYFYLDPTQGRDGKLVQRFIQDQKTRTTNTLKLWQTFAKLEQQIKGLAVASDQSFRAIDLAVDFCEDVERLDDKQIDQIVAAFKADGAQAKISSIHVNAWFGQHDKFSTCKLLLKELYDEEFDEVADQYVYFGDSPNDEPLFEKFPKTIGVANVVEFLPRMKFAPRFITKKPGGDGFAEAVRLILEKRRS
jgi:HAD superfamily hydrolase (TIGR01484 family)